MLKLIDYSDFDWKNPDYSRILEERQDVLNKLTQEQDNLECFKKDYADNPNLFINHFATLYDPHWLAQYEYKVIPFVPYKKQVEAVDWMYERFTNSECGILETQEGCGAGWLSVYFAVWLWLFWPGVVVGFGSTKTREIYDKQNFDSVFSRILYVLDRDRIPKILLPKNFWPKGKGQPNFYRNGCLGHPDDDRAIVGDVGKSIAESGMYSIYFVIDGGQLGKNAARVDFNLSRGTDCRIDISKHMVFGSSLNQRSIRLSGTEQHFKLERKDDPRFQ